MAVAHGESDLAKAKSGDSQGMASIDAGSGEWGGARRTGGTPDLRETHGADKSTRRYFVSTRIPTIRTTLTLPLVMDCTFKRVVVVGGGIPRRTRRSSEAVDSRDMDSNNSSPGGGRRKGCKEEEHRDVGPVPSVVFEYSRSILEKVLGGSGTANYIRVPIF